MARLRAGPLTAAMGLISRRSELEALVQQIGDVDERIEILGRELAEGTTPGTFAGTEYFAAAQRDLPIQHGPG